jgi:hypothetical protein
VVKEGIVAAAAAAAAAAGLDRSLYVKQAGKMYRKIKREGNNTKQNKWLSVGPFCVSFR